MLHCCDCSPANSGLGNPTAGVAVGEVSKIDPNQIASLVAATQQKGGNWAQSEIQSTQNARSAVTARSKNATGREKRIADAAGWYLSQYIGGVQTGAITQKDANTYFQCARIPVNMPHAQNLEERRAACQLAAQAKRQGIVTGLIELPRWADTPWSPSDKKPATQQQPAPTQQQPAPTQQQPAPTQQQPAPTQQQPAPTQQQPAPTQQQPAPTQRGETLDTINASLRQANTIADQLAQLYNTARGREVSTLPYGEGVVANLPPVMQQGTPGMIADLFGTSSSSYQQAELSDVAKKALEAQEAKIMGIPAPVFYVGAGLAALTLFLTMSQKKR